MSCTKLQYIKSLMSQIQLQGTFFSSQFFCFNCDKPYDSEAHYPYILCAHLHTLCHRCLIEELFKGKDQNQEATCTQCKMNLKLSSAQKFTQFTDLKQTISKYKQNPDQIPQKQTGKQQPDQKSDRQQLLKQKQINKWLIQYSMTLNSKYQQIVAQEKLSEAELNNKIKKYQNNLEKLSKDFWKVRGDHQFQQQNHQKIIEFSQHIIKNSPNHDYNTHGFGNIEDQVGLFESDTVKWYSLGRSDKNFNSSPYDILSLSYLITKNFGEAQVWYTTRLAKNDSNYQLILGLANTKYNLGKYTQAETLYKKVIQLKPNLEIPYQEIAFIKLLKQNNKKEARQWAYKTEQKSNNNVYADYIIAVTQEDIDKQIQSLVKLTETNKNYARAYNGIGVAYKTKKNYDQAIKYYKKAIDINPKYDAPYNGIGIVYYLKGQNDEAIKWFQECIKVNPKYQNPYFGLGAVYHKLNKNEEALMYYKKCVELNPKNFAAYNGLGVIEAALKRYDQALMHFQKCIQINPKHELSHNSLGNVHLSQGHFDKAIESYQKAIEINPKYGAPYNGLSNLFVKKGNEEQAKKWYQKKLEATN